MLSFKLIVLFLAGKVVSSDDYDISLMMYLLNTLADIDVGDLYAVKSDKRVSAMLSRIKYIRKKVIQSSDGKLSKDHFNTYWDDIGEVRYSFIETQNVMAVLMFLLSFAVLFCFVPTLHTQVILYFKANDC